MFENASGWGLERTFAKWVDQQPWRHCLPPVFQLLDYIYVDLDLDIDRYTYIYIYIYVCVDLQYLNAGAKTHPTLEKTDSAI